MGLISNTKQKSKRQNLIMSNIFKIERYISSGCNKNRKIGLELEHFICGQDYKIVTYEEVTKVLSEIIEKTGASKYMEEGHLFGFITEKYWVSLEPGCQIEISIIPQENVEEIEKIYNEFRLACEEVLEKHGMIFVESGVHPLIDNGVITPDELPLLPRKRYELMDRYFQNTGSKGKYMMRATASTQVSLDFESEEDAIRKMQVLEKLAPVLGLLTETGNKVKNRKLFKPFLTRTQIWHDVDDKRCGYFPGSLSKNYSLEDYAKYVYETPSILLNREGEVIDLGDKSAKDYYGDEELKGTEEHILSMFFPTVRLKKYVEYRVADSMPIEKALGYAALVSRLMYDKETLDKLAELFSDVVDEKQIYEAEKSIIEHGYQADVYGRNVCEWLGIIFEMALSEKSDKKELCSDDGKYIKKLINLPFLNHEYAEIVRGNEEAHLESGKKIKDYLLSSTAKYHERVVRTLYLPKLFTENEVKSFEGLIETLYGIFGKVIAEYERNSEYRALFGFDERLEKLILRPKKYDCDVPIARIDIFHNDETGEFKFCEFNTDGTSAMNEDRELNIAFRLSDAWKEFEKKYHTESFELFDTWVSEVVRLYQQSEGVEEKKLPNVAIVDFMESGTVNEFEIFRQRFEEKGIHTVISDIREIDWDGENCITADGTKIDIIYRRAVTSDIMAHFDEVQGFISAAVAGKVCLMGDFRTQIVHNKLLFKVLHMEETMKLLTKEEQMFVRAHVPMTISLCGIKGSDDMSLAESERLRRKELFDDVMNNKNKWIIKPEDSYGSKGVLAGEECTDEVWRETVLKNMNEGYILQEFVEPYRLRNIDLQAESTKWITTSNLTGLFVYGGKFKGCYSRVSFDKMISTQYNEMSLPTMVVEV